MLSPSQDRSSTSPANAIICAHSIKESVSGHDTAKDGERDDRRWSSAILHCQSSRLTVNGEESRFERREPIVPLFSRGYRGASMPRRELFLPRRRKRHTCPTGQTWRPELALCARRRRTCLQDSAPIKARTFGVYDIPWSDARSTTTAQALQKPEACALGDAVQATSLIIVNSRQCPAQ